MPRKSLSFRIIPLAFALLLFAFLPAVHAQCKPPASQHPVLSPAAQASVTLNGKTLTVYYCAPSARGRKVMGELVPYGKVWRTGANTSTTLRTDADLRIGKQDVPAGSYTLYTLPSATVWKLIINKQVGQWGLTYHQPQDLARIPMKKGPTPSSPVETFKIYFDNTHGNHTQLHLAWENTDVYVPVTAVQ
ncbi:MAG: DUF2911 domain-containing protein [Acidobacteriaceae bacterium]